MWRLTASATFLGVGMVVEEVSYYLGVPVGTLYSWRVQRRGPACRRIGRFLRYRPEDVTAWFAGLGDWPAAG